MSSVDKLEKAVSMYLAKRSKGGVSDFGGSFAGAGLSGGAEGCCRMCSQCAKCGGAINLQPRPKGGELAKPVGPRPNVSFFGAGLSGGRMAQMAGMGMTGGAGQSAWVAHVKKVAAQKGLSYKDALKVASKSYRRGGMSCGGAFMGSMSDPMGDRNIQ